MDDPEFTKNTKDKNIRKIEKLKREKNAIILAHNYQLGEVQDIADYLGDSLELSQKAAKSDADVIVFCGVHFMAETASILCPEKTVLIPDVNAGCPMADMITRKGLQNLKKKHKNAVCVGYINTPADVKADVDICCTSANAVEVVNSISPDISEIIFVPDKYLADYVSKKTGKQIIAWDGFCPTHADILPEHIMQQKKKYPGAEVLIHPECTPGAISLADKVLSTGGMCRYAKECDVPEGMIIGTETGILHRLRKENPKKIFYPASEVAICQNMKKITMAKVLKALEEMKYEVKVPEEIRIHAKGAVDRMIEVGRGT